MFDIGSILKRANIFRNGGASAPPTPFQKLSFGGQEEPEVLPSRKIATPSADSQMSNPEGPMMSRYKQFLAEPEPQLENYQPSKMQRLTAALTGISKADPRAAQEQLMQPYMLDMQQRNNRGRMLAEGAKLENDLGNTQFERGIKQRDISVKEKNAESLSSNRDSLVDSRLAKQRLNEWKAANPNKKLQAVKGGNLMAFDPISGELEDTGISTGTLTEKDLQDLKQSGSMQQIGARTAGQIAVEGVRSNNRLNENDQKQDHRMELAKFAAEHKMGKMVYEPGGNVYIVNPDGSKIDTGIATGKLTDRDKQYYDMVKIGLKGEETRKNITAQGDEARKTKQTPRPDTTTTKTAQMDDKGNVTGITTTSTQGAGGGKSNTPRPKMMVDSTGKRYDTSTWSEEDIFQATKNGFKVYVPQE